MYALNSPRNRRVVRLVAPHATHAARVRHDLVSRAGMRTMRYKCDALKAREFLKSRSNNSNASPDIEFIKFAFKKWRNIFLFAFQI